jgi:hypothetical protein
MSLPEMQNGGTGRRSENPSKKNGVCPLFQDLIPV